MENHHYNNTPPPYGRQNWRNPSSHYQDQYGQWRPNPNMPDPNLGTTGFIDAIKICFNKYADFNGRAPRAEYWWWTLFYVLADCVVGWFPILGWAAMVALIIPSLAVTWRRLHDIGKGGGWCFLGLIPFVGQIILIVWMCQPGEPYPNRFGPNPYASNIPPRL